MFLNLFIWPDVEKCLLSIYLFFERGEFDFLETCLFFTHKRGEIVTSTCSMFGWCLLLQLWAVMLPIKKGEKSHLFQKR